MKVRVLITGRGYPAANSLPECLELQEGSSLDRALEALAALLPAGASMAASSLVAVSGRHLGTIGKHKPQVLRDGDELAIIAPVAGG